jgi:hypothetical protein
LQTFLLLPNRSKVLVNVLDIVCHFLPQYSQLLLEPVPLAIEVTESHGMPHPNAVKGRIQGPYARHKIN